MGPLNTLNSLKERVDAGSVWDTEFARRLSGREVKQVSTLMITIIKRQAAERAEPDLAFPFMPLGGSRPLNQAYAGPFPGSACAMPPPGRPAFNLPAPNKLPSISPEMGGYRRWRGPRPGSRSGESRAGGRSSLPARLHFCAGRAGRARAGHIRMTDIFPAMLFGHWTITL
jgi:hypothetical protein